MASRQVPTESMNVHKDIPTWASRCGMMNLYKQTTPQGNGPHSSLNAQKIQPTPRINGSQFEISEMEIQLSMMVANDGPYSEVIGETSIEHTPAVNGPDRIQSTLHKVSSDSELENLCNTIIGTDTESIPDSVVEDLHDQGVVAVLEDSTLNPNAAVFVPKQKSLSEHIWDFFFASLDKLNRSPADFDSVMQEIISFCEEILYDEDLLEMITTVLIRLASNGGSFPYHSVKVASALIHYSEGKCKEDHLQQMLVSKIIEKYKFIKTKLLPKYNCNIHQVKNFLQFLAEVYVQVKREDDTRLNKVVISLLKLCIAFHSTMHVPVQDRFDAILPILKIIGKVVDEGTDNEAKMKLNELWGPFWLFADKEHNLGNLDESSLRVLDDLTKTRYDYHWGKRAPPQPQQEVIFQEFLVPQNLNPIFYAPDGNVMTYDEESFLLFAVNEAAALQETPVGDFEGMDDEMWEAYEDFEQHHLRRTPAYNNLNMPMYQYHQLQGPSSDYEFNK